MTWEEACRTLGVAANATSAEIKTQWLYKANLLHPDKTANLPESMREKAEDDFKQASLAYDFLKDTRNNPYTTPPKLDIRVRHIRFKELEPGEKKRTSFEIRSSGGPYTKFWIDDAPAPWLRITDIKSTTGEPLPLEVTVEATGTEQPGQQARCRLLIRLENGKTKSVAKRIIPVEIVMRKAQEPSLEQTQDPAPQLQPPQPPPVFAPRLKVNERLGCLYIFIVCLVLIIIAAVLQYRGR